jgi:hypothetical protein
VTVAAWIGVAPVTTPAAAADEVEGAPKHDDPKAAEARAHYEEGTKAYNLGEYPRAVTEFKAAYNAKPDPLLLYNIAQSFRLGGDAAQALFFYRSFLRNMPGAPNRKEVEGRIRTLEKQVEKQAEKQVDEQKHEAATSPGTVPPAPATSPTAPAPSSGAATTTPPPPAASPGAPAATTTPPPAAALPAAVEPAARASAGVDISQAPAGEPAPSSSPFYKKWWFWTGVGVVLLVGVAAVAARDKPPSTTYGLHIPKFTP